MWLAFWMSTTTNCLFCWHLWTDQKKAKNRIGKTERWKLHLIFSGFFFQIWICKCIFYCGWNDPVAFNDFLEGTDGYLSSNLATQLRHTARVLHDRESLEKRQASSPMDVFDEGIHFPKMMGLGKVNKTVSEIAKMMVKIGKDPSQWHMKTYALQFSVKHFWDTLITDIPLLTRHFLDDDFAFPQMGYVSSMEGMSILGIYIDFQGYNSKFSFEFVKKVWQNIGQMLQILAFGNASSCFFFFGGAVVWNGMVVWTRYLSQG